MTCPKQSDDTAAEVWPSQATIGARTGRSDRSVRDDIRTNRSPQRSEMPHTPGTLIHPRHRRRLVGVAALMMGALVFAVPGVARAAGTTAAEGGDVALTAWKAVVLGLVEGLTEYLPVSSTGHLLITSRLLGLPSAKGSPGLAAVNTYSIAIQFGAIAAVAGLFWRRFVEMFKGLVGRSAEGRHLLLVLVIAFTPSAAVGALLDRPIEEALFGPWPIVAAWTAGGIAILALQRTGHLPKGSRSAGSPRSGVASITTRQALIIGLAQCIALWPGTSRSLATIVGALLVGVALSDAVEFSFLLGFATLSAATGFKLLKDGETLVEQFGVVNPLLGAAVAAVAAVIAIKWMVTYLERHDMSVFAYYRLGIAAVTVVLLTTQVI